MNNTSNTTAVVLPEWVYYEQIAYSGIVALIGIPGNILIILMFACSREKSTTDYMVFSMAISDLLGSLVCTTFNILLQIQLVWTRIGTTFLCRLGRYFSMFSAAVSISLLSVIAIDRYMKTCRPHSVAFTVSRARLGCAIVCTVVAAVTSPSFIAERFDIRNGSCKIEDENWLVIPLHMVTCGCALSCIITAVVYILVAFALCKRLKRKMKKRRAARVLQGTRNICLAMVDSGKNDKYNNKDFDRSFVDQTQTCKDLLQ